MKNLETIKKLKQIKSDFEGMMHNIEWNVGNCIGMAYVVGNPQILNLSNIPPGVFKLDELELDTYQALGIALVKKDRLNRQAEIISSAKRFLVADSAEVFADSVYRLKQISFQGKDPYDSNQGFSVKLTHSANLIKENVGQAEGEFIEKCVAPLRHNIRHNLGKIVPLNPIQYKSFVKECPFFIMSDGSSHLKMSLKTCHDIHRVLYEIGCDFANEQIDKLVSKEVEKVN